MNDITLYLETRKKLIDRWLLKFLPSRERHPNSIYQALHYTLFAGGKRIRPILTIACAESLGCAIEKIFPSACALELIHTYSLIHDDLPAMDNDNIRRGKPSSHKVFGDAIAILAGDALLTHAFSIVSDTKWCIGIKPEISLKIIHELSEASGIYGMITGQVLDIESVGINVIKEELLDINNHKTASLFKAAVRIGGILCSLADNEIEQLTNYGYFLGLAFQIVDDLFDIKQEKKLENKKPTYPSLVGVMGAKKIAKDFIDKAISAIESFDYRVDILRQLAQYIIIPLNRN